MIMAVRAAPSSVPATPKREVTKDAPVAASPADIPDSHLLSNLRCSHSRAMNLSGCPPRFKGRTKLFREEVLAANSMAAEVAARVESAYGYQWRRENDGARRREVHGPFR